MENRITDFGNSKKKKAKAAARKSKGKNATDRFPGKGAGGGDRFTWTAEKEAPLLWWWETDEAARVPWGLARLLGLLLRSAWSGCWGLRERRM